MLEIKQWSGHMHQVVDDNDGANLGTTLGVFPLKEDAELFKRAKEEKIDALAAEFEAKGMPKPDMILKSE